MCVVYHKLQEIAFSCCFSAPLSNLPYVEPFGCNVAMALISTNLCGRIDPSCAPSAPHTTLAINYSKHCHTSAGLPSGLAALRFEWHFCSCNYLQLFSCLKSAYGTRSGPGGLSGRRLPGVSQRVALPHCLTGAAGSICKCRKSIFSPTLPVHSQFRCRDCLHCCRRSWQ